MTNLTPAQQIFRRMVVNGLACMRADAVRVLQDGEAAGALRTAAKIRRALADIDEALKSAEADVAACPLQKELTPPA